MDASSEGRLRKSAGKITKGEMSVMVLSEADVMRLLDLNELMEGLAAGFRATAHDAVQSPDRPEITIPGRGFSLSMPAWQAGMNITVKVVNVFEGNLSIDLPNHLAVITVFDPDTGAPLCFMDGTYITGIRTAASAVLSIRELARKDARVATVIGAGVQGREHLRLLPLARDFDEIRITSLHYEDAERLARQDPRAVATRDVEAAVRTSDIVCLASHSYAPVIQADWVREGTHVSSVGYAPPNGELPVELIARARLFVETADAFKAPPVGCGELAGIDPQAATLLGNMLANSESGRQSETEITVYKAMGIAMEDMVAAHIAYTRAQAEKSGQTVIL